MLLTNYGAGAKSATEAQRAEAKKWLTRAARQGHPDASNFLHMLAADAN